MKSTSLPWRAIAARGVVIGSTAFFMSAATVIAQTPPTDPVSPPVVPATTPVAPVQSTDQPPPTDMPAPAPATETPATAEVPATQPADDMAPPASAPAAHQPAAAPVSPEEQAARSAMGERFAQLAKILLSQAQIVPPVVHQHAALVECTARENPTEPRFLRLLIESRLRTADTEAGRQALREALLQYLKVLGEHRQTDVVAQIRLIDLNERDLQSAQKRVEYLQAIVAADGIGSEVRSHAALLLARVYAERGQDSDADASLEDAVRLNPLNILALRAKYERQGAAAPDAQRMALLLGMLRSNPAQPDVMASIARELADNGVLDEALNWYERSFFHSGRMGRGLNMPDYIDFAATLLVAGRPRDAYPAAEKILQSDPGNGDAALIRLAAQRQLLPADQVPAADELATSMLLKRLDDLHAAITQGEPAATTQPLEVVNEYIVADAQKLKEGTADPALTSHYIGALARLAWFQIYYRQSPDTAAKAIEALRVLLPQDETVVTRLEGWSFFRRGDMGTARNKLSAVAERDPLSRLGLILIAEKEAGVVARPPQQIDQIDPAKPGAIEASPFNEQLIQLAGTNAAGITGVVMADALIERGLKFAPGANAAGVRDELARFPMQFLQILDKPDQFYKLTAEPLSVSHKFGQPILAQITVTNVSEHDITLGDDGALRPDLWFDTSLIGSIQQFVPAVSYDRLSGQVVLKARDGKTSQVTRLDDGRLSQLLLQQPVLALPMQFSVFTNPVPVAGAPAAPGPGGYRVQFTRVVERSGTPVGNPQAATAILQSLVNGTPEERMRTVDHICALIRMFGDEKATPEAKQMGAQLFDALNRAAAMHQRSPVAQAWLEYNLALMSQPAERERFMGSLLRSTEWDARVLGLRLLGLFPPERQRAIASKFAQADPDPLVKQYAQTVVELSEIVAAQPATQPIDPALQPGTAPPTDPNATPTSPPP